MTFEPSICSRIAVLAPPTKKEANLLFDLLLRLGFDAQFSVRPMPSSLVASALEPLAARAGPLGKTLTEFFNATTRINGLLLAGIKRMAA